jgi:hypothetical protein
MSKTVKGETPETETQVVPEAANEPEVQTPEVEKFDEARAKELIAKLRVAEKQGKADAKVRAELEAERQTRIDAEKSELQKAQELAARLEADLKVERIRVLRRDAADKIHLPAVFADRLQGETPEELEADALKIMAAIPTPVAPKLAPTNPGDPQTGETVAEKRKRLGFA